MAVLTVGLSSEFDGFFHLLKKKKREKRSFNHNKKKRPTIIKCEVLVNFNIIETINFQ